MDQNQLKVTEVNYLVGVDVTSIKRWMSHLGIRLFWRIDECPPLCVLYLYNNSRHYKPTVITQHWAPTLSTPLSVWPPCAHSSLPSLSTALWPWFTSWLHVVHLLWTASNCFSFSLPLFRSPLNLIHSLSRSFSLCLSCYHTFSFIPIWPPPKHSLSLSHSGSLHLCLALTRAECNEEGDRWES